MRMDYVTSDDVRKATKRYTLELMGKQNVNAVGAGEKIKNGISTRQPSVVCTVRKKIPAEKLRKCDLIPAKVGGVPTDVVEDTDFVAQAYTKKHRPAFGGLSIGHVMITAGTFGCLVRMKAGNVRILSNNHVLANSNDAETGDAILQPGKHDGGVSGRDDIGVLDRFVPIKWDDDIPPVPCPLTRLLAHILNAGARRGGRGSRLVPASLASANLVDAAIAIPLSPEDVSREIRLIGNVAGVKEGSIGLAVRKSGRTTELTEGEITQTDVTVRVGYGGSRTATFTDQLMMGAMSEGGDSGSLVLSERNEAVGLLFAGSEKSTIACRIQNVIEALDIQHVM